MTTYCNRDLVQALRYCLGFHHLHGDGSGNDHPFHDSFRRYFLNDLLFYGYFYGYFPNNLFFNFYWYFLDYFFGHFYFKEYFLYHLSFHHLGSGRPASHQQQERQS